MLAVICKDKRLSIHNGLLRIRCNLYLAVCGAIASFIYFTLIFCYMPSTTNNYSSENNSNATVTSAHETCEKFQVIHQIILPERPRGLIGEKVVISDKYAAKFPEYSKIEKLRASAPYFTIIEAWIEMREKGITVMIRLDVSGTLSCSEKIALNFFKKYESNV